MSHAHHWHPHVSVPFMHLHAPHLEWHEVAHPARLALVTTAGALTLAVAVVSAPTLPALYAQATAPSVETAIDHRSSRELPREWRFERKAVSFDGMIRSQQQSPGIQEMYSSPQTRAGGNF